MDILKNTMKTFVAVFLLTAVMALPPTAEAQQTPDSRFSAGALGGITQTNFYGTDVGAADWRPGFNAGLFFTYQATPFIAVQPEVSWNVRGAKNANTLLNDGADRFRLDYIDIPVLLKVGLPLEHIQPRLLVGPYLSILADAERNGTTYDDNINNVDFGGIFGLEIGFPLANATNGVMKEFFVGGRYNISFVDVNDVNSTDVFNNGFQQQIGLSFNL